MTAEPHLEPPDHANNKRKAGSPPEGEDGRQQKRGASAPPDAAALEERRWELAEVYAAYDALYRAYQQQRAEEDGGVGGSSSAVPPLEASFLRLLQAGQGEPPPLSRLLLFPASAPCLRAC